MIVAVIFDASSLAICAASYDRADGVLTIHSYDERKIPTLEAVKRMSLRLPPAKRKILVSENAFGIETSLLVHALPGCFVDADVFSESPERLGVARSDQRRAQYQYEFERLQMGRRIKTRCAGVPLEAGGTDVLKMAAYWAQKLTE